VIAALPMYDWPETRGQNDILWARISAKLNAADIKAPSQLTRPIDLEALWLAPDLLLAQTCSYPLETVLKDKVKYVATPSYSVEGCETPGHYRSAILMRGAGKNMPVPDDIHAALPNWLPDARLAINSLDSMSGYHALKRDAEASGKSLPSLSIKTGSHRASIIAVAEGNAEFCAVDCVSWAMAQTHEPAAKQVHVAGWTKQRPGLPLITSLQTSQAVVDALVSAAQSVLAAVVLPMPTEF
jgi:ABC-type phosphate/phosphonate transport system substrate-binding protein